VVVMPSLTRLNHPMVWFVGYLLRVSGYLLLGYLLLVIDLPFPGYYRITDNK
jgi:hypothetical protein